MNIKKNITINLTEADIKEIIADYLKKEGYSVEVDDISINVGMRTVGFYTDEHSEPYFRGIDVKCKEK